MKKGVHRDCPCDHHLVDLLSDDPRREIIIAVLVLVSCLVSCLLYSRHVRSIQKEQINSHRERGQVDVQVDVGGGKGGVGSVEVEMEVEGGGCRSGGEERCRSGTAKSKALEQKGEIAENKEKG